MTIRLKFRHLVAALMGALLLGTGIADAEVLVRGSKTFKDQVAQCFALFRANDPENIIPTLENSKFTHQIFETDQPLGSTETPTNAGAGRAPGDGGTGKGSGSTIMWNPTDRSNYQPGVPRDPCSALYHELYHSYEDDQGVSVYAPYGRPPFGGTCAPQVELNATIAQNEYLSAIGKPTRTTYSGDRLCSSTIVDPPKCPPGFKDRRYCSPAKARRPHVFSPRQKRALKIAAITVTFRGLLARIVVYVDGVLPGRFRFLSHENREFLQLYSFAAPQLAAAYTLLATNIDPLDFDFNSVATPNPARPPHVNPGDGISVSLARDLNLFGSDTALAPAVVVALSTSINRAQAAQGSGASGAYQRQLAAISRYARQEATLLRQEIGLSAALERDVGSVDSVALQGRREKSAAAAFEKRALTLDVLHRLLGYDYAAVDLRALRAQLNSQLEPLGIAGLLRTAQVFSAERQAAQTLAAIAATPSQA